MLSLNKILKYPLNQSYCRLRVRTFSQKLSSISASTEDQNNPLENLLKHYDDKLLYNTVIESHRLRFGYSINVQILRQRSLFKERMQTAIQTIQPLPLTLKHYIEDNNEVCKEVAPETHAESTDDDGGQPHTSTNFPYNINTQIKDIEINTLNKVKLYSIEEEIAAKKKLLDESNENWMTHYENYEQDLVSDNELPNIVTENWKINYGTPDPRCRISNQPCGGCGAHLHCKDTAIPGYIPSEIFKNSMKPGGANLASILCQRCHFLNEYNIALQVRVSPDDYPKVLQTIATTSALPVLMVDLTDFPCSIWPGLADILGPKMPIIVVGNKVDLLPKDDPKFLKRVKEVLIENLKLSGFAGINIIHVELISAKTGYGVENFITALNKVIKRKGNVYLIGCTNVGKSSLFNLLLQSDLCKIQAVDLVQRATTSPWPGTTLNLLKFPITRFDGYRAYLRHKRLSMLREAEASQRKLDKEALNKRNIADYATLMGHIERSTDLQKPYSDKSDSFSVKGNSNLSGKTKMGINENLPQFAFGKWCYDTPGVIHPDQILHLLTTEELIKTLPKELIRPETYCLKPGSSLFIAGIARLDYVQGPNSIRLTVFRAKSLPITICKMHEADSIYAELLGSDLFVVPILKGDRAQKWPGLALAKNFQVSGKCANESSYDVVLSSAGWIAINCGLSSYEFSAWTPEKRGVYVRDSLLPKAVTLRGARIRDSVAYKKHKFI